MKSEISIMPRPKTVLELVSAEWLRRNSSYSKHLSSVIPTGLHAQRALWIMQEIDGIYIPFREVEVLCHALKGQTDQLSDDELAYIVGSKLDPIAAAAVDDIEMQIEEVKLPKLEDSEENWKSRDRRVNELLEQLSSIMHNCSVISRQNSRAA